MYPTFVLTAFVIWLKFLTVVPVLNISRGTLLAKNTRSNVLTQGENKDGDHQIFHCAFHDFQLNHSPSLKKMWIILHRQSLNVRPTGAPNEHLITIKLYEIFLCPCFTLFTNIYPKLPWVYSVVWYIFIIHLIYFSNLSSFHPFCRHSPLVIHVSPRLLMFLLIIYVSPCFRSHIYPIQVVSHLPMTLIYPHSTSFNNAALVSLRFNIWLKKLDKFWKIILQMEGRVALRFVHWLIDSTIRKAA